MSNPVVVIAGAGPQLGSAIGHRFGLAGYDIALVGRSNDTVQPVGEALQREGFTTGWTGVDMTDDDAFAAAVARFGGHAGRIDHLHFNPSAFTEKDPLTLTPAELLRDLHLGVASLLTAVQAARPFMGAGGKITATGSVAADKPWAAAASLGVQKAGLRNLVSAVDATLRGDGIRAMTFTIVGTIGEGVALAPERIADALFEASNGPAWRHEVSYPATS